MDVDGKGSSLRHCCKGAEPHHTRGFVYCQYDNALSIVFISSVLFHVFLMIFSHL